MSDYVNDVGKCDRAEFVGGTKYPLITSTVELEAGQGKLKKGAILGRITSSNKFKLVDSTANDGSQVANCVLVHDAETDTSVHVTCYVSGQFKADQLYVKSDGDIFKHAEELRAGNIYITTEV